PFTQVDLSNLRESEYSQAIRRMSAKAQESLDLSNGPLLRVIHFDLGKGKSDRLLIVIHHLAVDGVSWRILLEDLQTAIRQLSNGESVSFPLKTTSFKKWAECLAEYAGSPEIQAESNFWNQTLQPPIRSLPVDFTAGANLERHAQVESVTLTAAET